MRTGWGPHLPIPWLPPWEGLRQEGPGELQGPLRGSKDQGRTGRLGPQPSLSLPPHLLPSHLFKMKNRKAEKQWMGGRELGGVSLWQDKVRRLPAGGTQCREVAGAGPWVGIQLPEGPEGWRQGSEVDG